MTNEGFTHVSLNESLNKIKFSLLEVHFPATFASEIDLLQSCSFPHRNVRNIVLNILKKGAVPYTVVNL